MLTLAPHEGIADRAIRLDANESALGPSPSVARALAAAAPTFRRYPDRVFAALRSALAKRHAIDPHEIVFGIGSSDLIARIVRTFLRPGDRVVHGALAYPLFHEEAQKAGAQILEVPEPAFRLDIDGMIAVASGAPPRLVYLANPNNPTGTYIDRAALLRLRNALPGSTLLLIDAAYGEFVGAPDFEEGFSIVRGGCANTIILKTFSKIHGLAGLRLGWACAAPAVLAEIGRCYPTWGVNTAAVVAAAASLEDSAHLDRAADHNGRERRRLMQSLDEMGIRHVPTSANFILVLFADETQAQRCADFLKRRGIVLRPMKPFGLPQALRISIGLEDENAAAIDALRGYLRDDACPLENA